MTDVERTRQQLDPAGTMGMRLLCCVLAAAAFVYALVVSLVYADERTIPLLSALALVIFGVACVIFMVASSPYRAPLGRRTHLIVHGLGLAAIFVDAASQWGTDRYIVDDWGPLALGTLLLALAPYRPALELATGGVLSGIFLGFLTLIEAPLFATAAPPVAFMVVSVTPMLAFCFGGVAFSASIVGAIERWQSRAEQASRGLLDELKGGIARSVQQDRVTILNRDVVPFFSEVLARPTITEEDRVRARAISDSIRSVMVADIDRSWLENVVGAAAASVDSSAVVDPARVASMMTTHQRTAMRAFLVELLAVPGFDHRSLRVVLSKRRGTCLGVVTAAVELGDSAMRSALAPYFAVMRVVFSDLQIDFDQPRLALRFSYEQR